MELSDDDEFDEDYPQPYRAGRALAVTGALLQFGVLLMLALFLVPSPPVTYPKQEILPSLAGVELLLYSIAAGYVGLVLLLIALLGTRYRETWFFLFLAVYGALLTVAMPFIISSMFGILTVGLIPVGPVFLIYSLMRRRDFFWRRRLGFSG